MPYIEALPPAPGFLFPRDRPPERKRTQAKEDGRLRRGAPETQDPRDRSWGPRTKDVASTNVPTLRLRESVKQRWGHPRGTPENPPRSLDCSRGKRRQTDPEGGGPSAVITTWSKIIIGGVTALSSKTRKGTAKLMRNLNLSPRCGSDISKTNLEDD